MLGVRVPPGLPPRMNRKRDITIICIVLLGLLAGVALAHGITWGFVQLAWDDRPMVGELLSLSQLLGYGLALGGVVFTIKHGRTFTLANEVVEELSKVTWPTKEETSNAT